MQRNNRRDNQRIHRTYLLTIWQEGKGPTQRTCFQLEDARSGARRGFVEPITLLAYLVNGLLEPLDPVTIQPTEE
jgi:hypothetical protein